LKGPALRSFAVIGLGRFGSRLATNLAAAGAEVIAIDRDLNIIEDIKDRVGFAVAIDVTDEQALRAHGVHKVDAAIVGIGSNFEATILCTVILKHLEVPTVIARATNAVRARVLTRVGADAVVNPEDESADRWSQRLVNPHFLNQIEFHEGYSIVEVQTPTKWAGKTLAELDLRAKYGLHVVAIKRPRDGASGAAWATGAAGMASFPGAPRKTTADAAAVPDAAAVRVDMPSPTQPLVKEDILVLMGKNDDLAKVPRA
jgi:trk system potassium uptake protein